MGLISKEISEKLELITGIILEKALEMGKTFKCSILNVKDRQNGMNVEAVKEKINGQPKWKDRSYQKGRKMHPLIFLKLMYKIQQNTQYRLMPSNRK